MANMDPPGSVKQQQQRRWSVGRSSTSRSHFSPRSSEAFYASAEPLSGRGGRALHNASGSGPDPDSNSAPDSCGAPEAARNRQYRTSVRSSQEPKDRRATATSDRELFHTVPRGLAISRKEILRRRCVKDDTEIPLNSAKKEQLERPRTLPSIGRRTRQDAEHTSSLLKRVSRQDILRRRASAEAQLKDVAKIPSNIQNPARWAKEDRDLSRPSTLPKILHASRSARLEEYVTSRTRESVGREAPIYGRIRRRKMSLPTGVTSLRDSATSLSTLTRFSKTKTSGERAETSKVVRHLRDPVPDTPDRSKYANDASGDDIVYAKVARKVSRQVSQDQEEKPGSIDRAVSRRRIISNVDHADSFERKMHQDRDQELVQVKHDAILVSKADFERVRNFKVRKHDSESTNASSRVDSVESRTRKNSRTDSWSRSRYPRTDFTTSSERQVRCRSKSQSGLLVEGQKENPRTPIRPTTLPSYVKIGRKTSTGHSTKDVNEQRRASNAGLMTKQTKERSNYVRKTATHVPAHVRAFSDANSVRSCSPATSSSIFGFCTGKRKTSSVSRGSPSWNLKTV
ncbi:uncharacterized protein LOC116843259 [Odontomachus brunneus]|uniref:uncharacterized protein LOC116843259 n=1 Tax=Odontomachus brunneus TaxID=486640 RepID=UPI0013F1BCFE|nr:uncharacterized protein LOC116843259 [Odontomachus brunneus]